MNHLERGLEDRGEKDGRMVGEREEPLEEKLGNLLESTLSFSENEMMLQVFKESAVAN